MSVVFYEPTSPFPEITHEISPVAQYTVERIVCRAQLQTKNNEPVDIRLHTIFLNMCIALAILEAHWSVTWFASAPVIPTAVKQTKQKFLPFGRYDSRWVIYSAANLGYVNGPA